MAGTKAFFEQAQEISEEMSDTVVTDRLASFPRAINEELGKEVKHQVIGSKAIPWNRVIDHRNTDTIRLWDLETLGQPSDSAKLTMKCQIS